MKVNVMPTLFRRLSLALILLAAPLSAWGQAGDPPANPVYPVDVAVSDSGEIYVVDLKLPGVWKLQDGKPQIHVRGQKQFRTPLNAARCAIVDADGLLVGDSASTSVLRIKDGKPSAAHEGRIGIPMALAVAKNGDILAADLELRRIWRVPASGGKPTEFAQTPAPRGLAVDSEGRVWVVCHGRDRQVIRFDADGKNREVIVSGRPFKFPNQIVVADNGDAFVADGYSQAIWKIPAGGEPTKLASGGPLKNPVGLALQGDRLLVADPRAKAVFGVKLSDGAVDIVAGGE